jgi:predicted ATPase
VTILNEGAVRVLTLTGPGGVGKTRIDWDVATELREQGRAPVPVELAPVRERDLVLPKIARALRVLVGSDDLLDVVVSVIGDEPRILVLDNSSRCSTQPMRSRHSLVAAQACASW